MSWSGRSVSMQPSSAVYEYLAAPGSECDEIISSSYLQYIVPRPYGDSYRLRCHSCTEKSTAEAEALGVDIDDKDCVIDERARVCRRSSVNLRRAPAIIGTTTAGTFQLSCPLAEVILNGAVLVSGGAASAYHLVSIFDPKGYVSHANPGCRMFAAILAVLRLRIAVVDSFCSPFSRGDRLLCDWQANPPQVKNEYGETTEGY